MTGIPVSTTHTKTTAIMGVGAARRLGNVNWNVVKDLVLDVYKRQVDLQQKKTIELETKEALLSTQQSLLLDQEAELKDKEELLATTTLMLQQQQEELEENRTALTAAQQSLSLQQSQIEDQAALLAVSYTHLWLSPPRKTAPSARRMDTAPGPTP